MFDFSHWKERLLVPNDDSDFERTNWCNRDLIPMPKERRTYGSPSFFLWWFTGGFSIVNYTTGASFIAYGLTGQQSLVCAIIGPFILGVIAVFAGWMGATHHIGYTISSRMVHGMRGSYLFVFLRCIPALIYDGIEAYWGGQAVSAVLGALSPKWAAIDRTLAGGTLLLTDFIGFLIFYIFFLIVMRIPPEKLQKPFLVTSIGFFLTIIGLLAWATSTAGGAGPYFHGVTEASRGNLGWSTMFGLMAIVGNFSVTSLGMSDWTRYSKTPRSPLLSQLIACPLAMGSSCVIGIIVTSCSKAILGEAIWQPYSLLQAVQAHYNNSPGSRAAVFFAALACACAQITVNIILNSYAAAMDITAVAPKYLNIRRAAYVVAAVGLATCPWQITSAAATFMDVLAGFGVFYGPAAGVQLAEFFFIRKRHIKLEDLYIGNSRSIYWYWHGFNWRSYSSFFLGLVPTLPGFIMAVHDPAISTDNPWIKMYHLGFLLGLVVSFSTHMAISTVFPPPHRFEGVIEHIDGDFVLEREPSGELGAVEKYDEKLQVEDRVQAVV
ncbi:permease for cytosine/purines, uracil, thiamine, allantoin-domain-containing protein [Naematelia encephala]|uniref:Permease for cytosine/purines, uracil, thiamine, allantoin-domain-containing protein n=1 Tax=Naematelia encephala TaxID=71784 RepID=A0A1Y2APE7_9TREE|nr:permease for cytosine/purines, uracil, thiamine, allantoin-domain-containing protein [Naematelia encephala]